MANRQQGYNTQWQHKQQNTVNRQKVKYMKNQTTTMKLIKM